MRVVDQGPGSGGGGEPSMYAAARKIYPQAVHGRFRRIKWIVLYVTLGIYYCLPFVRWDRGPNAPDQAVLIDLAGRRAYFFFIEIWPQEVYYLTGLLIVAAMVLFLMNAIAGRVWCGYLCPQTVWTDLFMWVERLIEGDRRERQLLDKAPWGPVKITQKISKHTLWLLIAWWTGGAWVLYFADAPTMVKELATGTAPLTAYASIAVLTFTTYTLAGFMREQVCTYMCPWPRIQAALTDEWALNVAYKIDRGEPRGSLKHNAKLAAEGLPAGDCIDCQQCVAVCPTGVDIRDGAQLGCIQCGLCIDACDTVMARVDKPTGLIGYDTDVNILRREEGKPPIYRFIRARTAIYAAIIVLAGGAMLWTLATRSSLGVNVLHDRNPVAVQLSDGGVRNGYTVRLLNMRPVDRSFEVTADGLPAGSRIEAVGVEADPSGQPLALIGPDRTRELRVLVFVPRDGLPAETLPVTFKVRDVASGETATAEDFFHVR